jgi:adenylate cyclase
VWSKTPIANSKLLINFILVAALVGACLDFTFDNTVDYWIHDAAIVSKARNEWKYVAVVTLDEKIPLDVSRIQALPLFALATERLVAAGSKHLFLDARVSKQQEGRMPYATCIESNGEARWSVPQCTTTTANQCQVLSSEAGNAPLKMSEQAILQFHIAPFPSEQKDLPEFLLFDFDAAAIISDQGVVASDALLTRNSSVARWINLREDHAVLKLAESVDSNLLKISLADSNQNEVCDSSSPCRRIRLSKPLYAVQSDINQLFLPLSSLASCDEETINAWSSVSCRCH